VTGAAGGTVALPERDRATGGALVVIAAVAFSFSEEATLAVGLVRGAGAVILLRGLLAMAEDEAPLALPMAEELNCAPPLPRALRPAQS
jgi:hypothetical protein